VDAPRCTENARSNSRRADRESDLAEYRGVTPCRHESEHTKQAGSMLSATGVQNLPVPRTDVHRQIANL